MAYRDHEPVVFNSFKGLYDRGDPDDTPLDYFQDCENIKFVGPSSFKTRDGIGISQDVAIPLTNVKRIYNYPTQTANTLIVLTYDLLTGMGEVHHVVDSMTTYGPILSIAGMTDFAFIPYAGRGYISPFSTFQVGELNVEKGLQNEFLYVYAGDGTSARKAAGVGLSGTLTIANGAAGHTDAGLHVFGFVSESISGFFSAPAALGTFTTGASNSVSFGNIPTSGDPNVTKRHLVATKIVTSFNGNKEGYQFFFVPNGTINDNTSTSLNNISFYDADLLDDASYLFDNYGEIPAGAVLSMYHNRLILCATFTDISLGLVSAPGEPEAINQIDGLIIMPLDGNPITNAQELRDILFVFKRSKSGAFTDNGDAPSSWPYMGIDNALGTSVHGIATVLDSGASSIDFLLICTYQGLHLFNGRYIIPELSVNIDNRWKSFDRNDFRLIQIINFPMEKEIYIVSPDRKIYCANYALGMDPKNIRWVPWTFAMGVNTIAVRNIDEIVIGVDYGL